MCMICNTSDEAGSLVAIRTLGEIELSRRAMAEAASSMLEMSKIAATPEARRQYDRSYKRMRRLMRDWNRIEHEREKA